MIDIFTSAYFINTSIVLCVSAVVQFLFELYKTNKVTKIVKEIEHSFNTKIENLKSYIEISKHININRINQVNEVITSVKDYYYLYYNLLLCKSDISTLSINQLKSYQTQLHDARFNLIICQRKFNLNIENDLLNDLLLYLTESVFEFLDEPIGDFIKKAIAKDACMEIGSDELGNPYEYLDIKVYKKEADEFEPAKLKLKNSKDRISEIIVLFREFNNGCQNHLKSLTECNN